MKNLRKLLADFLGLARVCDLTIAFKWLCSVLAKFNEIRRRGDLQPADRAMGEGPFQVSLSRYGARFKIAGTSAISGIREMYVRDTYLHFGLLRIEDGDTVVDLGANMGNFTNLALSCGPNVNVVAVEPSASLNESFRKSVSLNAGHPESVCLIRAFLGTRSSANLEDPSYSDAPWITEEELIETCGLSKVDFLKCDIEGGEFGLLTNGSRLLSMTRSLAIEVHAFAGDVSGFVESLRNSGFSILATKRDPDGTATVLARRT